MSDFNQEISVTVAGVTAIGKSPYGEVAVYAEGSTTAVFGWMTSADVFVPFEDGTITGDGAIVLDCGRNVELAVNVTGVPAKIYSRGIRNAPGS